APLEGLDVDTDLRWELLTALVAAGRAGEAEIAAEEERDATATGQRAAARARAIVPTAAAKERAWASVVESAKLPNALQGAVIAGFTDVHDRSLLVPFVDRYFAALERVWAERTNEMAQGIVTGLFPFRLAGLADTLDVDVLERADAW